MTKPEGTMRGALELLLTGVLCLLVLPAMAADRNNKGDNKDQAKPAQVTEDASKYVGSDTCKGCHEDLYNAWAKSPHWKTTLIKNGSPEKQGCEGCHGPGADHVAGGGDKSKIYVFKEHGRAQDSTRCLACHGDSHGQSHFAESPHSSNEVGCLDCHSPHHAQQKEHLLVQSQTKLCYGCHATEQADFSKPYHHRIEEGLVQCTDCHNPHGSGSLRETKNLASGDAVCFKCHAEKQGPYVYEHEPVKTDGCSSCHTPHGSTNPRLLKVSQVNMLCLQCHTYPGVSPAGPVHNQSAKYQACTMCHGQIHGSNFSDVFFK
jgi:DmsE family decaheme c-type cytochrome